jgi:spoIIIJ-associated protein
MLDNNEIEQIEKIIQNFFNIAGFDIELETENEEETFLVNITRIEDPKIFIGKQGLILKDLQLLLRKLVAKDLEKNIYLNLDIDNYKKNKIYTIKSIANSTAEEVILTQKDKIMPPLSAFERRIIHLELEGNKEVITETVEIGGERRLVVKMQKTLDQI